MKITIIIKGIGWSQSQGTNWVYNYYDVTIISSNIELLKYQGLYEDTFGSITNYFRELRENEEVDFIQDNHLSDAKQSRRMMERIMKKQSFKSYDLSELMEALK